MAFIEASNDGLLSGTATVTIVPGPPNLTRRIVKAINISNSDTASVTVTVQYVSGGGTRQIAAITLSVGDTMVFGEDDFFVLDNPSKSITCFMSAPAASINPSFVVCWGDAS